MQNNGIIKISPEGLELANAYLTSGSLQEAADNLYISVDKAAELLDKAEVKRYIDSVYLDVGYRNRFRLGNLMDKMIESKLEEAEETGIYTSKDLLDILALQHKMTIEDRKVEQQEIKVQNNVSINATENVFGTGNYGALMKKLLGGGDIIEGELLDGNN